MKLFVAGLPFDMGEQELTEIFVQYGTVSSAKIINDRDTGKSRGFGFVELGSDAEGNAAIQALDGGELEGRKITVKVAEDKPKGGGGERNFNKGNFRSGGSNRGRY